jgi:hypothetical protein
MTGPSGTPMTCPNGHPVAFAGQRFCEVCRVAIGAPPVPPAPVAAVPQFTPPPAYTPPAFVPTAASQPTMPYATQPVAPQPVGAGPASRGGGRSGPLLLGLVAALVVVGGAAFVLVARPFGVGGASPSPVPAVVAAAPTPSPTAIRTVSPAPQTIAPGSPTSPVAPSVTAEPPGPGNTFNDVPSFEPTPPPDPAAATGTWVSPSAGSTFTAWTIDLAATPILPTPDAAVSKVAFDVVGADRNTTICEASQAESDGTWTCTADLVKAGIPPGPLTLTFDITDANGNVSWAVGDLLDVTYAAVPPKPASPKIATVSDTPAADGNSSTLIERVTWTAPAGYATKFQLYAVMFCPNDSPTAKDGTPCLTEHTALPSSKLKLVGTAKGDARSMTIKHVIEAGVCGGTLWCSGDAYALVLAAYNDYGQSVLTIVTSVEICHTCTY